MGCGLLPAGAAATDVGMHGPDRRVEPQPQQVTTRVLRRRVPVVESGARMQAPVRQEWLAKRTEEILEPGLPIVDPHHHLWDAPRYRYMFPELLADLGSGHNIVATMYELCATVLT